MRREVGGTEARRGIASMGGALVALVLVLVLAPWADAAPLEGIHKIQHVVMIMQENRSFDSYFGTFPGANGDPRRRVRAGPGQRGLRRPVPRSSDKNYGGPHGTGSRLQTSTAARWTGSSGRPRRQNCRLHHERAAAANAPKARRLRPATSMGYHDARDIPNYWTYAQRLRAAGRHVRVRGLVEPARAPVSWSRAGRRCARTATQIRWLHQHAEPAPAR